MTYPEAINYIKECSKFGLKLGLERISEILKRLGNPESQFKAIHIAGTNGKGTTSAMFDAVLHKAGYQTGRYNSPHLSSYRERFNINNQPISKERLAEVVTKIKQVLDEVTQAGFGSPTEFEVGTALAFQYFAEEKVDFAIIEVGMGGRFDATNVICPVLSVITHIALDHQEYLGDTLEKIAFEKAGIIKEKILVVIGMQDQEIEYYLQQIAESRNAPCKLAGTLAIDNLSVSEDGTRFRIKNSLYGEIPVFLKLIGHHQAENCLNILAGLELLKLTGVNLERDVVLQGLAEAVWPGRLESFLGMKPSLQLYLDGSHNPDGAKALVKTLKEIYPGQKIDFLVGILNNRPISEIAMIFGEIARKVIVTEVPDPKSTPAAELGDIFREMGIDTEIEPDQKKAFDLLLKTENSLAVVTGSLYLIGYIRSLIFNLGD